MQRLVTWIRSRLDTPRWRSVVLLVTVVLSLPSLFSGRSGDDWFQVHTWRGRELPELSRWDLFRFIPADDHARLMDHGVLPWWAGEDLAIGFWRPLSSATHILDYVVFGDQVWLHHVHSLLWYVGLLAVVAALFRRWLGPLAAMATLIFALDDAHAVVLGWLANRNGLCAGVFGGLALLLYEREGWRARVGSIACFAAALLSAEAGLAAAGWIGAAAFFLGEPGAWRRRLLSLWPYVLVVVLWQLAYRALGYGATGSGAYRDPSTDLPGFLLGTITQAPVLAVGTLLWLPLDALGLVPGLTPLLALLSPVVGWGALQLARAAGMPEARARFWIFGTLFACMPFGAGFLQDRHLVLPSLGAAGLVAEVLAAGWSGGPWLRRGAVGLALLHLVWSPLLFAPRTLTFPGLSGPLDRAAAALPGEGRAVLLNVPIDVYGTFVSYLRAAQGYPVPERLWWLCAGLRPLEVARTGSDALEITQEGGWFAVDSERFMRSAPLASGARVELDGLRVEVLSSTPDGRPERVRFTFDRPLEQLHLLRWGQGEVLPWTPPPVGETAQVPAAFPF